MTPEQFLSQPEPDEPDEADKLDPLDSIAASLREFVALIRGQAEGFVMAELESTHDWQAEVAALNALVDAQRVNHQARIDAVLAVCKPSVSKLANQIRDVLQPPTPMDSPTAEEAAPGSEAQDGGDDSLAAGEPPSTAPEGPPADDAPVEAWRDYIRSRGYAGPDVDRANRSQIRSWLGLAHPSAS